MLLWQAQGAQYWLETGCLECCCCSQSWRCPEGAHSLQRAGAASLDGPETILGVICKCAMQIWMTAGPPALIVRREKGAQTRWGCSGEDLKPDGNYQPLPSTWCDSDTPTHPSQSIPMARSIPRPQGKGEQKLAPVKASMAPSPWKSPNVTHTDAKEYVCTWRFLAELQNTHPCEAASKGLSEDGETWPHHTHRLCFLLT